MEEEMGKSELAHLVVVQHQRIAAQRSGRRRAVVARGNDGVTPAGGNSARKRVKAQGQVWQEAAIDLHSKGVSAGGSIEVVKQLATNPRLYSLNLGCNRLGAAGCHRIASAIAASETLTWLNLSGNYIGPTGADSLAQVLNGLQQLHTLNLCDNEIGPSGAGALADALCSNTTLATLTLSCNEIRSDGAAEIANALSRNATLKYLLLASNSIGDLGASHMAAAIAGRAPPLPGLGECSLVELQLGFNGITDNGADKLGVALKKNNHVTELGLPGNDISATKMEAIVSALHANLTRADPNF